MPVSDLTMQDASAAEVARLGRIAAAWAAYYGDMARPLKVVPGQPDDNVILNFARLIVDKGASFLFGDDLDFETEDEATGAYLEAVWTANRKATTLHKLAVNGGVAGHAWLKIQPQPGAPPRLIVLDPGAVCAIWRPDDYEHAVEYRIQYAGIDPDTGKPIATRQVITEVDGHWIITDYVSRGDRAGWEMQGEPTVWPFAWPPIIGCQNLPAPNVYWGVSDLEKDVLGLLNSINFVLSDIARILKFHAHPKTVVSGWTGKGDIRVDVNGTIYLPSAEAKIANLEMASDLSASLDLYNQLCEALFQMTRIPQVALGKMDKVGPSSGVALRISYQPIMEKTQTKRMMYGDMIDELNQHLLEMGGKPPSDITIRWPDLLPTNEKEQAEVGLIQKQLGVSLQTIIEHLGLDYSTEMEQKTQEGGTAMDALANQLQTYRPATLPPNVPNTAPPVEPVS